jgi:hypothetical protein
MAGRKVKIVFNGQQVDAEAVEATQSSERWNEYLLDDGTILKLKVIVTNVYRVEGHYDAEGNPVYVVQSTNVVSANAPQDLRRK